MLLSFPALNGINDLHLHVTHRTSTVIIHPISTFCPSLSRSSHGFIQCNTGIRTHLILHNQVYVSKHTQNLMYLAITGETTQGQPEAQITSSNGSKPKKKLSIACKEAESNCCLHEQHSQLFKDTRSFKELNGIYVSLLSHSSNVLQSTTLTFQHCTVTDNDHNFMEIQNSEKLLTDSQVRDLVFTTNGRQITSITGSWSLICKSVNSPSCMPKFTNKYSCSCEH